MWHQMPVNITGERMGKRRRRNQKKANGVGEIGYEKRTWYIFEIYTHRSVLLRTQCLERILLFMCGLWAHTCRARDFTRTQYDDSGSSEENNLSKRKILFIICWMAQVVFLGSRNYSARPPQQQTKHQNNNNKIKDNSKWNVEHVANENPWHLFTSTFRLWTLSLSCSVCE